MPERRDQNRPGFREMAGQEIRRATGRAQQPGGAVQQARQPPGGLPAARQQRREAPQGPTGMPASNRREAASSPTPGMWGGTGFDTQRPDRPAVRDPSRVARDGSFVATPAEQAATHAKDMREQHGWFSPESFGADMSQLGVGILSGRDAVGETGDRVAVGAGRTPPSELARQREQEARRPAGGQQPSEGQQPSGSATGRGQQNYIEGADGRRLTLDDLDSTPGLNTMSPGGIMRPDTGALREAQRAAAARGDWSALERTGAIDQRGGGRQQGGGGGGGGGLQQGRAQGMMDEAMDLYKRAERMAPGGDRSGALRRANAMMGAAESMLGAESGLQQTAMQGQTQRDVQQMQLDADGQPQPVSELDQARAMNERAQAAQRQVEAAREMQAMGQRPGFDPDLADALANSGEQEAMIRYTQGHVTREGLEAIEQELQQLGGEFSLDDVLALHQQGELSGRLAMLADQYIGSQENFAEGGLIPDEAPISAMASMEDTMGPSTGAMGQAGAPMSQAMGAPAPMDQMQVEYEQYAQGAESMGLPAIPFEQFLEMRQSNIPDPAQQPPMGMGPMGGDDMGMGVESYALGGEIPEDPMMSAMGMAQGPDASGAVVMDTDPNAPTDSIPALIDGHRPAALDSGEFVVPEDVVRFHGTKRLQQLIEQARQVEGGTNGGIPGATQAAS